MMMNNIQAINDALTYEMGRDPAVMFLGEDVGKEGGVRALEHHSESNEAIFLMVPGLKVVAPCTPGDMKGLLISSIRDPDPVIFLEHIKLYRAFREEVPEGEHAVPIGRARIVRPGKDLTILAWSAMVKVSLEAADELKKDGIEAEVIDLRTLKPLDKKAVLDSVNRTGRVVIVEEAHRVMGFGSELSAIIAEDAILSLKAPIKRVSGYDIRFLLYKLEEEYLPDPHRVIVAAKEVMKF